MNGRLSHALLLAALTGLTAHGCVYDLDTFTLCERDPEACSEPTSQWPLVPGCQRKDALQVDVGTGEDAFVPFQKGQAPALHAPSGGQALDVFHIFLGVRIRNPDPVSGKYLVTFRAVEPDPEHEGQTRTSVRKYVLGDSLEAGSDGSLARAGLRVFVTEPPLQVSAEVQDQCGRTATAQHVVEKR